MIDRRPNQKQEALDVIEATTLEEKKLEEIEIEPPLPKTTKEWIDDFQPLSIDDYLDSDPVDNHGDASFTGVWTAAKGLIQYLQDNPASINPKNVLEVGAGTGWLGITVARNCDSIQHIVLTDSSHTGAVQWTESNVRAARQQGLPNMDGVEAVAMDWNEEEQVAKAMSMYEFDLMLGSDLIYSEDRIQPLVRTISTLIGHNSLKAPRFLYAHTKGRMPEMDEIWEKELRAHGLSWKVLARTPQWDQRETIVMEISR